MTGRTAYFDPRRFPFVADLEGHAASIREELEHVLSCESAFSPWPERGLYGEGWDVFGLYAFGRKIEENCKRCPRTTAAVERVPDMTTAGFSRLRAGARIRPHVGFTDAVLRCHLALIVPERCGLRVGGVTRQWTENNCIVFDDTLEHEAWNESGRDRVVLLLDFLNHRQGIGAPTVPTTLARSHPDSNDRI